MKQLTDKQLKALHKKVEKDDTLKVPKLIELKDFDKIKKKVRKHYGIEEKEYDDFMKYICTVKLNKNNDVSHILTSGRGTKKIIVISQRFVERFLKKI